jgi:hypothetical protein
VPSEIGSVVGLVKWQCSMEIIGLHALTAPCFYIVLCEGGGAQSQTAGAPDQGVGLWKSGKEGLWKSGFPSPIEEIIFLIFSPCSTYFTLNLYLNYPLIHKSVYIYIGNVYIILGYEIIIP